MNEITNFYGLPEINTNNLTELEISHRNKYRNLYIRLIERGKSMTEKELSGYSEKHHILPRCLGGGDNEENLVFLPIRYHIMAHIILFEIYPENDKIIYAARCMTGNFDPTEGGKRIKELGKFSTRLLALIREEMSKKFKMSDEQREKLSKAMKGRKLTPEQLKIWSEAHSGEKATWYGKHRPEKTRKKISESVKELWRKNYDLMKSYVGKTRGDKGCAKKVVGPDGTIYDCLLDAVEASGIPSTTLRSWMKGLTKDNHGWSYLDPKNSVPKKRINHKLV